MKGKILLAIGTLALLFVPALGCVTDDEAPAKTSFVAQLAILQAQMTSVQNDISSLRTEIGKKADSSRVDALVTNGTGGKVDAYSKSETFTQEEIRNEISRAIIKLKEEITTINNNTADDNSKILSSDGVLELICERAPGDEKVWINDSIPVEWRLIVKNKGTSGTYFKIDADFDLADAGTAIAAATLIPSYDKSVMQFSPSTFSSATAVSAISFDSQVSASERRVWIPKSSEQNLYIVLTIDYADATVIGKRWNWDFRIRQAD